MGQSASNNNVDLIALKGMLGMAIRAVAFDIGGVLEITPDTGMTEKWEQRLHLKPGGTGSTDGKCMERWLPGKMFGRARATEPEGDHWDGPGAGRCLSARPLGRVSG